MPARLNKTKKISDLGEFGFIELIKKNMAIFGSVIKGIGDDAAVVSSVKNKEILLTTDMLLEGVHFTLKMPASGIGHKAMAVNISDIAAMGGLPRYALVSLGVPQNFSWKILSAIYQGMNNTALKFGVSIVGGDTIKSDKLIINVAMVGVADKNKIVLRSGAKPKDKIFVTGLLGNSLKSGRHLTFTPRMKESQYLIKNFKPTSMIDISDGIIGDLGHIIKESHAGAILYENAIPRHKGATLKNALYDGEDFELLFTLPARESQKLKAVKTPFHFYEIGEITEDKGKMLLLDKKSILKNIHQKGYTHF